MYEETVARLMNRKSGQVILDVGGGKSCPFAKYSREDAGPKLLALDVSLEEIKYNNDVDGKVVADVVEGPPFRKGSIDLITSRSVLEHLRDVDLFIAKASELLRADGAFVHLFPSKFAPFAIINQMLPKRLSRKALFLFHPETIGVCGHPAVYDRCYYSAIKRSLLQHGFELVDIKRSYYQSPYFNFFVPFFLASAFYEVVLEVFKPKNLSAYLLVIARKKITGSGDGEP